MGSMDGDKVYCTHLYTKWATYKRWRIITIQRFCPKMRCLSPTTSSPPWGPWTRKLSPQKVWLWRPMGLTFRRARRLWERETPLLKCEHKISHTPGPRAEAVIWKEPGSDPPADVGEAPGETGGDWSSLWGHRHWWHPFWGACSTMRTLVLANATLESSI